MLIERTDLSIVISPPSCGKELNVDIEICCNKQVCDRLKTNVVFIVKLDFFLNTCKWMRMILLSNHITASVWPRERFGPFLQPFGSEWLVSQSKTCHRQVRLRITRWISCTCYKCHCFVSFWYSFDQFLSGVPMCVLPGGRVAGRNKKSGSIRHILHFGWMIMHKINFKYWMSVKVLAFPPKAKWRLRLIKLNNKNMTISPPHRLLLIFHFHGTHSPLGRWAAPQDRFGSMSRWRKFDQINSDN